MVSPDIYLEWRQRLELAWQADPEPMTLLDANDQSAMYGYFIMHKPMSEDEALSWLLVVQACMPEIEDPAWDALERLQLALAGADEPVARTYLAKLVKEGRPDQPLPKAWRPAEVVSAMGRERAITPDDLLPFPR
jgi:hypothetical protein